jgi:hypothetical protein
MFTAGLGWLSAAALLPLSDNPPNHLDVVILRSVGAQFAFR